MTSADPDAKPTSAAGRQLHDALSALRGGRHGGRLRRGQRLGDLHRRDRRRRADPRANRGRGVRRHGAARRAGARFNWSGGGTVPSPAARSWSTALVGTSSAPRAGPQPRVRGHLPAETSSTWVSARRCAPASNPWVMFSTVTTRRRALRADEPAARMSPSGRAPRCAPPLPHRLGRDACRVLHRRHPCAHLDRGDRCGPGVRISDYTTRTRHVTVDWMRMTPYAASGSFDSQVFDGGGPTYWDAISWNADLPAGTSLRFQVRTGERRSRPPAVDWGPDITISGGTIDGRASTYSTTPCWRAATRPTPALDDVSLTCGTCAGAPAALTALTATPRATGNPAGQTVDIDLAWPAQAPGSEVLVYRKPFGDYPVYTGTAPATPATPDGRRDRRLDPGGRHPGDLFSDQPASRDYWHYVAFVANLCGETSAASHPVGAPSYHLGDINDGGETTARATTSSTAATSRCSARPTAARRPTAPPTSTTPTSAPPRAAAFSAGPCPTARCSSRTSSSTRSTTATWASCRRRRRRRAPTSWPCWCRPCPRPASASR